MSLIVTPTEADVFTALGRFLEDVLTSGTDVIQGQDNRVPEPRAQNFVTMTMLRMPRLSTNREEQDSLGLAMKITQSAQCVVQIDVHGPAAFNNANILTTTFRSSYATAFFAAIGPAIVPLYTGDPRQVVFVDGEKQYEDRYLIEANLQIKPAVTAAAQSARQLTVDIISAETDPAGWPNATVSAP